ncbi:MAG: hypothetical protein JNM98_00660 [Rhodocyclaceae bacterium]|nr:hypothetical protein [Rhodocyclaceae bacterium]
MATIHTAWKKTDGPVRYHGGQPDTRLGDRVEIRGWFRKRRGIVNYVPGISPPHGEMEHNLLYWVGVSFERGDFTGILVDPDTGCVLKKVVFLERGAADAAKPLPPEPFE